MRLCCVMVVVEDKLVDNLYRWRMCSTRVAAVRGRVRYRHVDVSRFLAMKIVFACIIAQNSRNRVGPMS
jgi:hypothetical protein